MSRILIFNSEAVYKPLNFNRKALRFGIALLLLFALANCSSRPDSKINAEDQLDLVNQQDIVVLLHGMWRNESAMRPVERFLSTQGYQVINIAYPSTEYPIETLVDDYLKPVVENLQRKEYQRVHFVTHSMGGILVRYFLKHNKPDFIGRVVMLAPPNQGTELATLFSDSQWINIKRGPAAKQLSTDNKSWVRQLGPVNFELGIIAGNYNSNWLTDWILPGDDDGVVSVESTKVKNMQDFVTVPVKHYQLRANSISLTQTAHFLKFGQFYRSRQAI